jgi:hypothetical protein
MVWLMAELNISVIMLRAWRYFIEGPGASVLLRRSETRCWGSGSALSSRELQNSGVGGSARQVPPGLDRCIDVTDVALSGEAVAKEGLWGREELGVVRELEARSLANGDVGCDAEESTLVGEAEWGSVLAGEDGPVRIDDSRAGEA